MEALIKGGPDDLDPVEAISSLVGQSVVFVQPLDEATPRYGMLETIREFALEQLARSGEAAEAHRRHAEFVPDLAESAEPQLLVPAERNNWMAEVEHAHDSIRAALAWSMSPDGVLAVGVDLAGALGWFWLMSGRLEEAGSWYGALLARRGEADDTLAWGKVLHGSALQWWGRGDVAQAAALEEPAVQIFRSAGDGRWLTYGLTLLARVRTGQERPAEARALLEEARSVWSRAENTYGQPFDAYLRYYVGSAALAEGDTDTARAQHGSGSARVRILLALLTTAAAAAALVACSSAGAASPSSSTSTSPAAATAGTVKTATINGATVLTNSNGFTLYSFAPDTPETSKCNGTCAQNWPPVAGPVTAAGVTGTFGTITRTDSSTQATFDVHPLYTYAGDTAPGQNNGNGLVAAGGLWNEVTTSGGAPVGRSATGSGAGGYGY